MQRWQNMKEYVVYINNVVSLAQQGDKEAARALSVSPLCDRGDQNLPKSQCDFIDFIVRPCVSIFSIYCKVGQRGFLEADHVRLPPPCYYNSANIDSCNNGI